MNQENSRPLPVFITLAVVTALFSIFSAVLMTEPGQSLNLPREWVVGYFASRWLLIIVNLSLLAALWWLNNKYHFWRNIWMILASTGVIICVIAANFMLTALFPAAQYGANYVTVAEANKLLPDDEVIYAVEINGETKGYPKRHLEIPHIAGAEIGGEEVVMTFCALSNLPVVYDQNIGDGQSDLNILLQTHNNLLMVDSASGELIQQITGRTEFSEKKIKSYPNTMMSWKNFKKLYPDAEVFIYKFDRALDNILMAAFEGPMVNQFSEEHGPIFPTLAMEDDRLPAKEQIWGLDAGGEQAAFTGAFLRANPLYQFSLGGSEYVIIYNAEFDVVNLYERSIDGRVVDVQSVDIHGQTSAGKLEKRALHNGVFWMVWAHWFPETAVFG
ncbi:MAG: hypothetical protein DRR06_20670 [Gammaproteobacteria bacterium]|nr:MAG: hypothetical protein DRR06_20670 [Gammaproteobacteria bacterium]